MLRISLSSDSLWRNRDFFLLWFGQAISTLGNRISSTVALPLLVLALTNSPAQAGYIAAIRAVPTILLGLLVGALIDRWDRKKVMVYSDLLRFFAYASVPVAALFGQLRIELLYLVALAEGIGSTFFLNAQTAALPQVVPKTHLYLANGYTQSAQAVADTIGPSVAGYLIAVAQSTLRGALFAFALDGLSYLVSVITLGAMRTPLQGERSATTWQTLPKDIRDGLDFLWAQPAVRTIAALTMTLSFFFGPLHLATILLAQQSFAADEATIGLLFSLSSVGGILGALLAPWLSTKTRPGYTIISVVIARAVVMLLLVMSGTLWLFGIGVALVNFLWPIYSVTQISFRQGLIPDHLQGRVNSNIRLFVLVAGSLGTAVGGWGLEMFGPRPVIWFMVAGFVLSAVVVSFTDVRRA